MSTDPDQYAMPIQSYRSSAMLLEYASSRAAIPAFTNALAKQVAEKGIRVNAVAPDPRWKPLRASGGQPEEKIPDFASEVPMLLASQEPEFRDR